MLQEYKCLKCKTETKDKKGDLFICPNPDCGLNWEVTDSGEWIIHGNLNLAWFQEEIVFPKKLTIHGDLNMMGVKAYKKHSCEELTVMGNIFMCNAAFCKIPPIFIFDGYLFCHETDFSENQGGKCFYTSECIKFVKLKEKLPEIEGLFE